MIRGFAKQYPSGKNVCRDLQGGGKVCAPAGAWSKFFATVNTRYGSGAEKKVMPKKVSETLEEILTWYLERIKDG